MKPMSTNNSKRSLRLLSIDNGGFRGLSPLLILREILLRVKEEQGLPVIPRPCEVFDLAGGTGTGGIIVIMLFRLQMSIDAAIKAYTKLSEHVFSEQKWFFQEGTFKTTHLEDAMLDMIREREDGDPRQVPLLNKEGPQCFVCAMQSNQWALIPTCFRSWTSDSYSGNPTIVNAIRATNAIPTFFKPSRYEDEFEREYLDVKLRCSNPTKYVLENARELYGDRPISCLLSLGTGDNHVVNSKYPRSPWWDPFRRWLPVKLLRALQDVIRSCNQTSMEVASEFSYHLSPILYLRLNDDDSLLGIGPLAEWRWLDYFERRTRVYFRLAMLSELRPHLNKLLLMLKGTEVENSAAERTFRGQSFRRYALHEIYHDELLTQGRGLPLSLPGPTPTLPQAYRQHGVNVGDVGIVRMDGPFDFLFNIFMSADHPINSEGVPDPFQPLDTSGINIDEYPCDMPGSIISSSPLISVHHEPSGLVFETSISEGAILVLPEGTSRKSTYDTKRMRTYMTSNLRAWYDYARKRRAIRNGDLVLVYRCDKAASCGMASFSGCQGEAKKFTFKCVRQNQLMLPPYDWELNHGPGNTSLRIGPYAGENNDLSPGEIKNQCVFLRTLEARLSEEEWNEFLNVGIA